MQEVPQARLGHRRNDLRQNEASLAQMVLGDLFDGYVQERRLDALPAEAIGDSVV